jgi:hypothetical protein
VTNDGGEDHGPTFASWGEEGDPPLAVFLWLFVIVATLVAGAAHPGAGLGVFTLGLLWCVLMELVMWRRRDAAHQRPWP